MNKRISRNLEGGGFTIDVLTIKLANSMTIVPLDVMHDISCRIILPSVITPWINKVSYNLLMLENELESISLSIYIYVTKHLLH